jgi:sugar-specific transcriptional regulator TrmB
MVIDLLQRIGLNKYEAEAYAALVQYGPLTGYELGKRSGVPLSRSYEILERLSARGLALQQPGDPPRYTAEPPKQFVDRTRAATAATLDALAGALADLELSALPDGFWVVRGREHILAHANTCIAQAQRTLALSVTPPHAAELELALNQARDRGCRILQSPIDLDTEDVAAVLLVADDGKGLVGTLAPHAHSQAVVSTNPAFVAALRRFFAPQLLVAPRRSFEAAGTPREAQPLDWLDWEERKQRRLLGRWAENHAA